MLRNNGNLTLANYHALQQPGKYKHDNLARELVASRLIVKNSLSTRARTYIKGQYFVNQSIYSDTVIAAVTMVTSFGKTLGLMEIW